MPFVLADAALSSTLGLVIVFFVVFPILAHGLIGFAVAQALGERQENLRYSRGEDLGPSQG
jgi:succinate dehydrogenase/fumarate reductase cytochrome b subunit